MTIYSHAYETRPNHSAKAMGSGTLNVLATPALVAFMENASYLFAQEQLDSDFTTVGSEIAIQHLAASAIGDPVTIIITALKKKAENTISAWKLLWENNSLEKPVILELG